MPQGKSRVHTQLFLKLVNQLGPGDFENMKRVVQAEEFGRFRPGELERFKSQKDLLEKLEHKAIVKQGDYSKLKEIMRQIDRPDAIEDIEEAEAELRKEGIRVVTDSADFASSASSSVKTEPPLSLNTNNSRGIARIPSLGDAMPSDVCMDVDHGSVAGNRDDRPRYEGGKGYVLFINNFVEHAPNRSFLRGGCEIDTNNIETLFEVDLPNYKYVLREDLTKSKLQKVLQDTKKKLLDGKFTRFILILCSHGEQIVVKNDNRELTEERIIMVDGESITEEDLTTPFMGDQFKEFKGKPKVFIVQACRSPRPDSSDDLTEDNRKRVCVEPQDGAPSVSRPVNADVLISYATSKGTRAWRNEEDGSWYIYHLCKIIRERYQKEHLMDLLVRVNDEVARMESTEGRAKQMPCQVSTLTKHIWL